MEINRETMHSGLRMMYIGELAGVIGLVLGLVVMFLPGTGLLGLFILLVALVCTLVSVAGLFKLRREHSDYMNALILLIAGFICQLISNRAGGGLSVILSLATSVLGLVRTYLIIRTTNTFLSAAGREDLTAEGNRAFYATVASAVVAVVISVLTVVLSDSQGGLVVMLAIVSLAAIAAETFYLVYLKHSADAMNG